MAYFIKTKGNPPFRTLNGGNFRLLAKVAHWPMQPAQHDSNVRPGPAQVNYLRLQPDRNKLTLYCPSYKLNLHTQDLVATPEQLMAYMR